MVVRIVALLLALAAPLWVYPLPTLVSGPVDVTMDVVPRVVTKVRSGSGVLVDGRVLTARHLLVGSRSVRVQFHSIQSGGSVTCTSDESTDFAVVHPKVSPSASARVSARLPSVGSRVTVAGYPGGIWTVTPGTVRYVMGPFRVRRRDGGTVDIGPVIVADWDIKRPAGGVSGGGMFDDDGLLVGIVCCVQEVRGFAQVAAVPIGKGLKQCALD